MALKNSFLCWVVSVLPFSAPLGSCWAEPAAHEFPPRSAKRLRLQGRQMVVVSGEWQTQKEGDAEVLVGTSANDPPSMILLDTPLPASFVFQFKAKSLSGGYLYFCSRVVREDLYYRSYMRFRTQNITLRKRRDPKKQLVLAESPGFGGEFGKWYDVKIAVFGIRMRVFVDDMVIPKIDVVDPDEPLRGGYCGFLLGRYTKTMFRDVQLDIAPPLLAPSISLTKGVFRKGETVGYSALAGGGQEEISLRVAVLEKGREKALYEKERKAPMDRLHKLHFLPPREGVYQILVKASLGEALAGSARDVVVIDTNTPRAVAQTDQLDLELVDEMDLAEPDEPDRLRHNKLGQRRNSTAGTYFASGAKKHSYLSILLRTTAPGSAHVIEVDYPDDGDRCCGFSLHAPSVGAAEYGGIYTGPTLGLPLTNKMRTYRFYCWPQASKFVILAMNWWEGHRAAVSAVRLYRMNGETPPLIVKNRATHPRRIGVWCEDVNGFKQAVGINPWRGGPSPTDRWLRGLTRVSEIMSHCGQNLFHWPVIWYGMGSSHRSQHIPPPRDAERYDESLHLFLRLAEKHGYRILPNITACKLPGLDDEAMEDPLRAAKEENWLQMGMKDRPRKSYRGWHAYNPVHPRISRLWTNILSEILRDYGDYPAFEGISIRMIGCYANFFMFDSLDSGYGDTTLELFTKETGLTVPVDSSDPERFSKRHAWLMANARAEWINWRCKKLTGVILDTRDRIVQRRPECKLYLDLYERPRDAMAEYKTMYRECGIDLDILAKERNIVILKRVSPNLDRHRLCYRGKPDPDIRRRFEGDALSPMCRGVFFYLKYWEYRYRKDREKERDVQLGMRRAGPIATYIADNGRRFLRGYARELAALDARTMLIGGWGLNFLGAEEELREFTRAYLTLEDADYAKVPNVDLPVTVREHKSAKRHAFYVVNESDKSVQLALELNRAVRIKELTTDNILTPRTGPQRGASMVLDLPPYSLRSFRIVRGSVSILAGKVSVARD